MKLVIFGATGGTGHLLMEQALQQGHTVTAFARNPARVRVNHSNLRVVKGDIGDASSVESAIAGHDAVLSALGVRINVWPLIAVIVACQLISRVAGLVSPWGRIVRLGIPLIAYFILFRRTTMLSQGTNNIVRAMEHTGVRRFICESSLGIGDSKGQLGPLYNFLIIPLLLRHVFADKETQEKIIKASSLQWTIVRPAALTNGPLTGKYRSDFGPKDNSIRRKISRADVAAFMLGELNSEENLRKTPGISY